MNQDTSCAKKVAEKSPLWYDAYVNLEDDFRIKKLGPFSTLEYSDEDVNQAREAIKVRVKNPVLPHGASSKEKAILAIHPRSSERGILAFSRKAI